MIARSGFGRATSVNPACSNMVTVPWKRSAAGVFSRAAVSTA